MAWIESHQEIARHPKTKRLARLLGVSVPQAIGHLHLLWWWALDYAQDGNLSRFTPDDLADACMWEGDPEMFAGALSSAGWMDRTEMPETSESDARIHDWDAYGGRWIEKRKADVERVRTWREGRKYAPRTDSDVTRNERVAYAITVPNRTEPNKTEPGYGAPARAADAAKPEIPVLESSEPPDPGPDPVPIGVPKPLPHSNKYGQFLKRVGELAKERGVEILVRGASSRNGSAVKDSPYSADQLATALAAYEAGEWTNEHIAKCGHPVWAVVEGSGLWLERDRLGGNGHAKTGGRAGKPEHSGRVEIHSDPRAFSGIDRG